MRKIVLMGVALLATASFMLADTVYTKDGKVYNGTITKAPGKVIIDTADGKVEVREENIQMISRLEDLMPQTGPASLPAGGQTPSEDPVQTPTQTPGGGLGSSRFFQSVLPKNLQQPESGVYLMMRKLLASKDEPVPSDAMAEYDSWRAAAHDRRRRLGDNWISQDIILKMKKTHDNAVADAASLFKQIKKTTTTSDPEQKKAIEEDNKKFQAQGMAKLRQAADAWPDRTLRSFLIGDFEMLNGNYTYAERYFQQSRTECPKIAAFWQGEGMAAVELAERQLEAVGCFIEAMKLCPESAELFRLLNDAMSRVSGTKINAPAYLAAQDFILKFRAPSTSNTSNSPTSTTIRAKYSLPGKEVAVKENELVKLPFDRLYVEQAVGIPVNSSELMVDAAVLKDALAVYVQLNPQTMVEVETKANRGPTIRKIGSELAALKITTHFFVPTKTGKDAQIKVGDEVWVYTADIYSEMGDGKVRLLKGKVAQVSDDGVSEVDVKLQPGDCSAPVVTPDGRLAGMLAGKTFVEQPGGGPDKFISLAKLTNVGGPKPPTKMVIPPPSMAAAYTEPLQLVPGQGFMIYVVKGETFKE